TTQTASPSTFNQYNTPGSRVWSTSWSVNGSVYLFGGTGIDAIGTSSYLNDLWTVQTVPPTN
ncbi:MAG TPA: hypothetical protein VNW52_11050, partial [Burkholderiaceae bacterium]|nr:hypothetical protein [Burkholderiaceae bacterium]